MQPKKEAGKKKKDVTDTDLKIFIGMILWMSYIKIAKLQILAIIGAQIPFWPQRVLKK